MTFLGWSEQEVVVWADRYKEYLADPEDIFYHADPPYWAVSTFIPASLDARLSPDQRSCLRNELLDVFGAETHLVTYLDTDWKRYKSNIASVIEKYAASGPIKPK